MVKRELKVNLKGFLIWTGTMLVLLLLIYMVYPSIINGENGSKVDEMVKAFPPEILKAFNMDIAGLDTAFGWLKSEGFVFLYLIVGIYSCLLGSNILLKEESEKTIEYLAALPISRRKVVTDKILVSMFYILSMILLLGAFNMIALNISEAPDNKQLLLLSITPIFPSIVLFALGLFISTFTHKTKKMLGISIGMVFAAYILNVISEMGKSVEGFKYISVFTLADSRGVITNSEIRPIFAVISLGLCAVLILCAMVRYQKKELV
ncbi:MAG: ABC transporter permease subunit [Lachnospiraceae bacterium]|nr:ABC transporter permease subunit [Lachnospiraceae bacterium]